VIDQRVAPLPLSQTKVGQNILESNPKFWVLFVKGCKREGKLNQERKLILKQELQRLFEGKAQKALLVEYLSEELDLEFTATPKRQSVQNKENKFLVPVGKRRQEELIQATLADFKHCSPNEVDFSKGSIAVETPQFASRIEDEAGLEAK